MKHRDAEHTMMRLRGAVSLLTSHMVTTQRLLAQVINGPTNPEIGELAAKHFRDNAHALQMIQKEFPKSSQVVDFIMKDSA